MYQIWYNITMKIKALKAFKGTETETLMKRNKIIKIEKGFDGWDRIFYKVPRGRKLYSILLKGYELEKED